MTFWTWADAHPIVMLLCVLFVCMAIGTMGPFVVVRGVRRDGDKSE